MRSRSGGRARSRRLAHRRSRWRRSRSRTADSRGFDLPYPQGFQKAQLSIDSDTIPCGFNPQDYTIAKTNIWTYKPTQGKDRPDPEFGGGLPMTYKLSLLLDSSLDGPDASIKDQANKLMESM